MKNILLKLTVAVTIALVWLDAASACNVPVFRYALERWRQDAYRVAVFHRGELSEADRKLVELLRAQEDEGVANFVLGTVDVDKLDDTADKELLLTLGDAGLPRLLVQYPAKLGSNAPIWSTSLSSESVAALTDSPVRKELVRRLADGQTAVWLVLESGNAEQDNQAIALVEKELKRLEQELKLPELTEDPADKLASVAPLVVSFSLLRVARGEAEAPLVEMLLRSEPDLAERTDPLVFPVFGRGRALYPLVGAGITADNIHQSAAFLTGACSCEVKELNPGFDLLLSAQWEELLSLAGIGLSSTDDAPVAISQTPILVPIPRGALGPLPTATKTATAASSPSHETGIRSKLFVVGGIAVASVLGLMFTMVALLKRNSPTPR